MLDLEDGDEIGSDRLEQWVREFVKEIEQLAGKPPILLIDGNPGQKTKEALRYAAEHDGSCSLHFKFAEFKSKGNGWMRVHRSLVRGLEEVRDQVGPLSILSGYRDPAHNTMVGGVSSSQHLHGNACDPVGTFLSTSSRASAAFPRSGSVARTRCATSTSDTKGPTRPEGLPRTRRSGYTRR